MIANRWVSLYAPLAALALLAGCTSTDLNQHRYSPPQVRMPGQQAATQPASDVRVSPVGSVPVQPLPQADDADPRVALSTQLSGANVVPPTPSRGSGRLDMVYNRQTRLLRWKTSWSGLEGTITGVQFHSPAGAGQTAPAAMIWPGPFGATYEGRVTLGEQQAADLLQGLWYVNVQTTAYPAGEIRGQLHVVE